VAALLDPNGLLGALHPSALRAVRKLARRSPVPVEVRSGRRTCAEQNDLYAVGRQYNLGSPPVTQVAGCRSWHVLGRAVDLNALDPSTGLVLASCAVYSELGSIWEQMGGVWGGRFSGFGPCGDAGHFEWHPGASIDDYCPDSSACESVERSIDRSIFLAHTIGSAATGAVVFGALGLAAGGAWYTWRKW
jgi:hypothetical protein